MTLWLWAALAMSGEPYVQVLGIAQDAGHPQAGCQRACCEAAFADPTKAHRASSVAIVDPDSGRWWLVDASPDLPAQIHGLPGDMAGVFVTHAHIGHYTGLVNLGREVMGVKDVPVWAMPRMQDFLSQHEPWAALSRQDHIRLSSLQHNTTVSITPTLSVTPLQVPHRDELSETVGFVIRGPNRAVLYLPDIDKWERWDTRIEDVLASVDVALLDGTFFEDGELPGRDMSVIPHPFISESMARFAPLPKAERAKVRFIHLNHTNPALDPVSESSERVRQSGMAVSEEGERHPL